MKVLIDPLLLAVSPTLVIPEDEKLELLNRVAFLVALTKRGHQLVTTTPIWRRMETEVLSETRKRIEHHRLNPGLSLLRRALVLTAPLSVGGQTWGIAPLFNNYPDAEGWMTAFAQIAAQWIHDGEEVVFAMRSQLGRNLKLHQVDHSKLFEKILWRVYVKTDPVLPPFSIECISTLRNLDVRWTRRHDDFLPDTAPSGGMEFNPHPNWESDGHQAIKTMQGKPAWIDSGGNGWSDPNTPDTSYHWDVHLNARKQIKVFAITPINITKFGMTDNDTIGGGVHHVPAAKASRFGK